jgi:hypothetical protein
MEGTLLTEDSIAVWEGEGGSLSLSGSGCTGHEALDPDLRPAPTPLAEQLTGTANQIQWAVQIKERVNAEFDRVAKALLSAGVKQADQDQRDTRAIIAILEEKRAEVMARTQAGYFIHDWQELTDQVRQMIVRDPRYLAIKSSKAERQR